MRREFWCPLIRVLAGAPLARRFRTLGHHRQIASFCAHSVGTVRGLFGPGFEQIPSSGSCSGFNSLCPFSHFSHFWAISASSMALYAVQSVVLYRGMSRALCGHDFRSVVVVLPCVGFVYLGLNAFLAYLSQSNASECCSMGSW